MNWNILNEVGQIDRIQEESLAYPILIFKHSSRCATSALALSRLERSWKDEEMSGVKIYFLDLIRYRDISNQIAQIFGVYHQSPQVILIRNSQSVYDESHFGISYKNLHKMSIQA